MVVTLDEYNEAAKQAMEIEVEQKRSAVEAACPGVEAISAAASAEMAYRDAFKAAVERGDSRFPERYRGPSSAELVRRFPRGAAYIHASAFADSSNFEKAGFGRAAMAALLAGEDHKAVMDAMERGWSEAASAATWRQ